ncbi:MAG: hypothetical protein CMJ18_13015 [Phycisphaeraceae bacterium]|nr:hypothetical protein [Phycisphaeraceae bacterium]
MKKRRHVLLALVVLVSISVLGFTRTPRRWNVSVAPSIDKLEDGAGYLNPSTQSFIRGHHWLESVDRVRISRDRSDRATIVFVDDDRRHQMSVRNLPLEQLVPRLHYRPAEQPDAFDAFNLFLAEFSRNGLSVPIGQRSDAMAHFETDLVDGVPWYRKGDYDFLPNPSVRPVRMSVVNNCLASGLWELSGADRTGEIYHAWFEMPKELYFELAAKTNGLDEPFIREAVKWDDARSVELDLDRLRRMVGSVGEVSASVIDREVGYSSQGSRRKLQKRYVEVLKDGRWEVPTMLSDLTTYPARFAKFDDRGRYSFSDRKLCDLSFLRKIGDVSISEVEARTHYDWRNKEAKQAEMPCLELVMDLDDHQIVVGNLPLPLLVPQEDFAIHGFGVGILHASGIAERRRFLVDGGPPPTFAYLCRKQDGRQIAINSHETGIEQIFIRTHIGEAEPWWEITITSYERIVDIVKYRVPIPEALQARLIESRDQYVSPLYLTYRDDNLR